MRLNHTLGEMKGDLFMLGEWAYHITIMGTPSATEPWGWQLDGHHLIINFFVLRDQVVATPTFIGSEPMIAESGKYKGIAIMQEEQNKALAFAQSLTPSQKSKAILSSEKTGNDNQTEAFKDNVVIPYEGIRVRELNKKQKNALLEVIGIYIGYLNEGHAEVRMIEIESHCRGTCWVLMCWEFATWFAWEETRHIWETIRMPSRSLISPLMN